MGNPQLKVLGETCGIVTAFLPPLIFKLKLLYQRGQ